MINFDDFFTQFHFLRPWLLTLIPIGFALLWVLKTDTHSNSHWKSVIDNNLLPYLLENTQTTQTYRSIFIGLLIAWFIACIAMAGPSWQQQKQPVIKNQDALVMVLDLTLSMNAEDQKPSRLIAAKRKIEDILKLKKDGDNALVVFSGSAHTVTPLTDDRNTLLNMLPALNPKIMPKVGNNVVSGIEKALSLFKMSGINKGKILLLTDDINSRQFKQIKSILPAEIDLSILTFGTEAGAPIPYNGFLKNQQNNEIILAKLDWPKISAEARQFGFPIARSTFNDRDIDSLGITTSSLDASHHNNKNRQSSLWIDEGYWLLFLLLPFVLMAFRKGWVLIALIFIFPDQSFALTWKDLWQTDNQQATQLLNEGDSVKAAEQFTDPQWRASSLYKAKEYEKANAAFSDIPDKDADTYYNMANTLTQLGKYKEAIEAYTKALEEKPQLADAEFNREIAKKLLEQQQKNQDQQNQDQQNQDQQNQDQQNQDQQNKDQQNQDQQNQDQRNQDQQNQDQQNQDQQNQDQQNQEKENQAQQEDEQRNLKEENPEDSSDPTSTQQKAPKTAEELEQERALKQWLRQLPDDSGHLLKRKFEYQLQQNQNQNQFIDEKSDQVW